MRFTLQHRPGLLRLSHSASYIAKVRCRWHSAEGTRSDPATGPTALAERITPICLIQQNMKVLLGRIEVYLRT